MNALPNYVNCLDYQQGAQEIFYAQKNEATWRYIQGVSGTGITKNNNRVDLDRLTLLPTILSGAIQPSLQTSLFNQPLKSPFLLAPLAYQKLAHNDGELASVQAAMAQDAGYCLSTLSTYSLEDVATAAAHTHSNAPLWFQLYLQPNNDINTSLIQRAETAGYSAIVITVDAPINGLRYHEARDKFSLPSADFAANLAPYRTNNSQTHNNQGLSSSLESLSELMAHAPSWQDIESIIQNTKLPVILKGILNPSDAVKAKAIGAQGVVVSNPGGRVLDSVPSSISMLPAIRAAVGEDYTLLFDSGIRSGTDAYKAIALGANAVMIGRPFVHALSVAGALGVAHLLRLLKDELLVTMSLMGNESIASIKPEQLLNAHTPLSK